MRIRTICFGSVALALLLGLSWTFAYQRGYSPGARDEFACWKQKPMTPEAKVLVGKRDLWIFPGGRKGPDPIARLGGVRNVNFNNIPTKRLP